MRGEQLAADLERHVPSHLAAGEQSAEVPAQIRRWRRGNPDGGGGLIWPELSDDGDIAPDPEATIFQVPRGLQQLRLDELAAGPPVFPAVEGVLTCHHGFISPLSIVARQQGEAEPCLDFLVPASTSSTIETEEHDHPASVAHILTGWVEAEEPAVATDLELAGFNRLADAECSLGFGVTLDLEHVGPSRHRRCCRDADAGSVVRGRGGRHMCRTRRGGCGCSNGEGLLWSWASHTNRQCERAQETRP